MTALHNILGELAFQFRVRGALLPRLACVAAFYARYTLQRLLGASQDESRLAALRFLSRFGTSRWIVRVRFPADRQLELDLYAASFMIRELSADLIYEQLPGFKARTGWNVLDAGGHQGLFATRAAKLVGEKGKVLVIEPYSKNADLIRRNATANGLQNVILVEKVAAEARGEAALYTTEIGSGGHSVVFKNGRGAPIPIPADTVDNILRKAGVEKIDLIKIDVEGAFLNVLKGATETLKAKPRITMEIEGGDEDFRRVEEYLKPFGYRMTVVNTIAFFEV